MYFKVSIHNNPKRGWISGYYRLVESCHNHCDRVCHRTILNTGFLDELNTDQLNLIQKILTAKTENINNSLFELPYSDDPVVLLYIEEFYNRMLAERRIDVPKNKKEESKSNRDIQRIDINSIRNKDVRRLVLNDLPCSQSDNYVSPLFWRVKTGVRIR